MTFFKLTELDQIESLDDPQVSLMHREIILKKVFLKKLYLDWYKTFQYWALNVPDGKLLEIGSGGGFLKDVIPEVITSDIFDLPHCDMAFTAEKMPFEDDSLSCIFMIDVLHHIPDCNQFFTEAARTLKKGGKAVFIEPANSLWAKLFWINFHHEPYSPEAKDWSFPTTGPLSGSNIALPWIIFERDLSKFKEQFPNLKLRSLQYHTPFTYLLSGGVSFKSFLPGWTFEFCRGLERLLSPLNRQIGMFQTIVIEKD